MTPYVQAQRILEIVADTYGVKTWAITSKTRAHTITRARMVVARMLRRHTEMSLCEIGCVIRREHTTVMHGIQRCKDLLGEDPGFVHAVNVIEGQILSEGLSSWATPLPDEEANP